MRDLMKRLLQESWQLAATDCELHHFRHPSRPGRITLPEVWRSVPEPTLLSVYQQAGWPAREGG